MHHVAHAGLVPDVLELFPEATVVGSKVALAYLKGLTLRSFKQLAVKGGDHVDLGRGHDIEFVMAPNLHWPDTMFSYDPATGARKRRDALGLRVSGYPWSASVGVPWVCKYRGTHVGLVVTRGCKCRGIHLDLVVILKMQAPAIRLLVGPAISVCQR